MLTRFVTLCNCATRLCNFNNIEWIVILILSFRRPLNYLFVDFCWGKKRTAHAHLIAQAWFLVLFVGSWEGTPIENFWTSRRHSRMILLRSSATTWYLSVMSPKNKSTMARSLLYVNSIVFMCCLPKSFTWDRLLLTCSSTPLSSLATCHTISATTVQVARTFSNLCLSISFEFFINSLIWLSWLPTSADSSSTCASELRDLDRQTSRSVSTWGSSE